MKFKIQRQRTQPARMALILLCAKSVFFAAGFLSLCYCASVLLDRWLFQAYQTRRFERALTGRAEFYQAYSPPCFAPSFLPGGSIPCTC